MQIRLFEFTVLGLWILVAVVLHIQTDLAKNGALVIANSLSLGEEEINIKRISILDNNLFELVLDGKVTDPIIGRIDCENITLTDAELKSLFKRATDPKAVLIQKQNGVWLLKINLTLDNKRTSLKNWINSHRAQK